MIDRVGQVLSGRYRLLAPIGTGASASVYLADDVVLRRRVAAKILHDGLAQDEAFLRRFRAEARAAAALNHPNVVAVFDWGQDPDVPYLITEYLGGGSLRALLDQGVVLSPAQSLLIGLEAARGLEYAHRRGFVHRDIKPANLLFDEDARLRIADFGLARALAEATWTEPMGAVLGTAKYASPEQARGESLTGKSDVYSLALVMVEACTGAVPFATDTTIGTLMARVDRPLPVPDSCGAMAAPLRWAGNPDPDKRPDAAELGAALMSAAASFDRPEPLPLAGAHLPDDVVVVDLDPTEPTPRAGAAVTAMSVPVAAGAAALEAAAALGAAGAPEVLPDVLPDAADGPEGGAVDDEVDWADDDDDDHDHDHDGADTEAYDLHDTDTEAYDLHDADDAGSVGSAGPVGRPVEEVEPDSGWDATTTWEAEPATLAVDSEPVVRGRWRHMLPLTTAAPTIVADVPDAFAAHEIGPPGDPTLDEVWGPAEAGAMTTPVDQTMRMDAVDLPADASRRERKAAAKVAKAHSHAQRVNARAAQRGGRRRRAWPRVLGVLLVLMALGAGVTAYWYYEVRVPTYSVPALIGRPAAEVPNLVTAYQWKVDQQERYDDVVPAGTVLDQQPRPNTELLRGATVTLVVSKGPPPVTVPLDLVGKTLDQATIDLRQLGLGVGAVEKQYHEDIPPNAVIALAVGTPAIVDKGSDVGLVVSLGPEPRTIPDGLVGKPGDQAAVALKKLDLDINTTEEFSETVAKGSVISTAPAAGAKAEKGSTVQIVVSKGPPTVAVPNVIGLTVVEAAEAIEAAGLTVSGIEGSPSNRVKGTDPGPGAVVRKGSNVSIVTRDESATTTTAKPGKGD